MMFSNSGRVATSCQGSHTDRLTPSDSTTETAAMAPKNHSRRSLPPHHQTGHRDRDHADPDVLPRQGRALVAADPVCEEGEPGRHRCGPEVAVHGGALVAELQGRPHPARDVGRAGECEPGRVGQQHHGGGRGGGQSHHHPAGVGTQRLAVADAVAEEQYRGHGTGDADQEQDLGAHEELDHQEQPEHQADGHRAAPTAEQQLVDTGHQERGHHNHPSMRWASDRLTSTSGENP